MIDSSFLRLTRLTGFAQTERIWIATQFLVTLHLHFEFQIRLPTTPFDNESKVSAMSQSEQETTAATTSLERKPNEDDKDNGEAVIRNDNASNGANVDSQSNPPPWLREDCLDFYQKELLPKAIPVKDRVRLLRLGINRALAVKKRFANAQFLEFGVHEGKDLKRMAVFLRSIEVKKKSQDLQPTLFHGFDSFEGLPEDWINGQMTAENQPVHKKGAFDTGGAKPNVDGLAMNLGEHGHNNQSSVADRIMFHKGWFHETLPPFFDSNSAPVAFVHADADLYGSTLTFLTELSERKLLRKGTVIIFDEFWNYPHWQEGEFKAWTEIADIYSLQFEYFGYHAPHNAAKTFKQYGYQSVGLVITCDMK